MEKILDALLTPGNVGMPPEWILSSVRLNDFENEFSSFLLLILSCEDTEEEKDDVLLANVGEGRYGLELIFVDLVLLFVMVYFSVLLLREIRLLWEWVFFNSLLILSISRSFTIES